MMNHSHSAYYQYAFDHDRNDIDHYRNDIDHYRNDIDHYRNDIDNIIVHTGPPSPPTATHCNTLQHTLQHTATHTGPPSPPTATHCNTLQLKTNMILTVLQCLAMSCSVLQCVEII